MRRPASRWGFFGMALAAWGILGALHGQAQTAYIEDTFGGGKGPIADRTPDKANVPGSKWAVLGFEQGGGFSAAVLAEPQVWLACGGNSNGGIAIAMGSPRPRLLRISASVKGADPSLGFYAELVKQDVWDSYDSFYAFSGLRLRGDGSLELYRRGGRVAIVKYTGTFDGKQFHQLAYDVDVTSGALWNVKLEGSSSDYGALTVPGIFTEAATAFAAVASLNENGRDNQVWVQDFRVEQIKGPGPQVPAPAAKPATSSILIHDGDRIGFMGDSITAQGNSKKGYVQLVIVGLKAAGVEAAAIPAGHSGDTSGNMLVREKPDVFHRGANWITLSCGVNDVNLTLGVDLETYKKNVQTMAERARAWGLQVVLLTPTPAGEDAASEKNQKEKGYVEFIRQYAAEQKIPLADMNAAFWKKLEQPSAMSDISGKRLLADGIHPNEVGQFLMATTLLRTLVPSDEDFAKGVDAMKVSAEGK